LGTRGFVGGLERFLSTLEEDALVLCYWIVDGWNVGSNTGVDAEGTLV